MTITVYIPDAHLMPLLGATYRNPVGILESSVN